MQVSVKNTDVLVFLLTDLNLLHFLVLTMKKTIEVEAFGNLMTTY